MTKKEARNTSVACLLTRDLMFSSRVTAGANRIGKKLLVVDSVERMIAKTSDETVSLVMIDLDLIASDVAGSIDAIEDAFPDAKMIAYTGHVKESLLKSAQETGKVTIMTRGQFNQGSDQLLEQFCA